MEDYTPHGLIGVHLGPFIFMGAFVIDHEFERVGSNVCNLSIGLLPYPCLCILSKRPFSTPEMRICLRLIPLAAKCNKLELACWTRSILVRTFARATLRTRNSCSVTRPCSIKASTSELINASVFEFAIPARIRPHVQSSSGPAKLMIRPRRRG